MKKFLSLALLVSPLVFAQGEPFDDNILFAFDKCRSFTLNLNRTLIEETLTKPFDVHCHQANTDKKIFKCDYFDTVSNKKTDQENLTGGRVARIGQLNGKSGTSIRFSLEKGTASYETLVLSEDGLINARKLCIGIFLFEKDAAKRKK